MSMKEDSALKTTPWTETKRWKGVAQVAAEHEENVRILSCENAVRYVILTPLLFKGRRMNRKWPDSLLPGFIAQMTSRGSMTTKAFFNSLSRQPLDSSRRNICFQFYNTQWVHSCLYRCDINSDDGSCSFVTDKAQKASPVPGPSGTVAPT